MYPMGYNRVMQYKIEVYETISGKRPYMDFLDSLDSYDASKLSIRVDRLPIGSQFEKLPT